MTVILIIAATMLSTALGGLFAIRLKDKLHLILGFSAGAVLGVALFDLLPEAVDLTAGVYEPRIMALLIAAGFSVYMLLDRFFTLHKHGEEDCEDPTHSGALGASALVLHSFLDGFGIGLAFKVSPAIGWVVALAVLTHDFSDGINTVNMILKDGGRRKQAIKWLLLDSLAPAVGVAATSFMDISASTLGLILSVYIGLFLYISASDLIPESHHRHPAVWTSLSTILGAVVIYIITGLASL